MSLAPTPKGRKIHQIITSRPRHNGVWCILPCVASLVAQMVKNLPAMQNTWIRSLGREDTSEKGMATHSSILGWRIPWTEEPGGLQSMGSQRVGHNWSGLSCTEARMTSHSSVYQNFFRYTRYWCSKARSQQTVVWGHKCEDSLCVFVHGSQMNVWSYEIQMNICIT